MKLASACVALALILTLVPYAVSTPSSPQTATGAKAPFPILACRNLDSVQKLNTAFERGGFLWSLRELLRLRVEASITGRAPPCLTLMYIPETFTVGVIERSTKLLPHNRLYYKLVVSLRQGYTTYYAVFMRFGGIAYAI